MSLTRTVWERTEIRADDLGIPESRAKTEMRKTEMDSRNNI